MREMKQRTKAALKLNQSHTAHPTFSHSQDGVVTTDLTFNWNSNLVVDFA